MNAFKKYVYQILDHNRKETGSKALGYFLVVLIIGNVFTLIFSTVKEYNDIYGELFLDFELFSIVVFTIEYILRLWVSNLDQQYKGGFSGRLKYFISTLAIIDLIAILPFYLHLIGLIDLRVLSMLRISRMLRIFKLKRYVHSLQIIWKVITGKKEEIFIAIFIIFFLLIVSSSLVFIAEHDAQPDKFSSIPATMWWGIATLTTVGYGDMTPVTAMGKIFGAFTAVFGIAIFAFPAGIISAGFTALLQKEKKDNIKICPHCGEKIDSTDFSKHIEE